MKTHLPVVAVALALLTLAPLAAAEADGAAVPGQEGSPALSAETTDPLCPVSPEELLDDGAPAGSQLFEAADACQVREDCPCPDLCYCVIVTSGNVCLCHIDCCSNTPCP